VGLHFDLYFTQQVFDSTTGQFVTVFNSGNNAPFSHDAQSLAQRLSPRSEPQPQVVRRASHPEPATAMLTLLTLSGLGLGVLRRRGAGSE
jgi:hypothetical protein